MVADDAAIRGKKLFNFGHEFGTVGETSQSARLPRSSFFRDPAFFRDHYCLRASQSGKFQRCGSGVTGMP